MKQAWDEIGEMIADGFSGITTTVENSMSSLIFHHYKIGGENWLTIKEDYEGEPVNTVNIEGEALEALYEFIGKVLNKH